jgi:hypothetical protein
MEVETALMRLREATSEINRSAEDNLMKGTLEKTWLLQDRIVFPDRVCFALFLITWTDMSSETRCKFKKSGSFIRTYSVVRSLACMLANINRR